MWGELQYRRATRRSQSGAAFFNRLSRGAIVNDDAQLVSIVVGNDERVIDYDRLDQLDDNANELTLTGLHPK